MTFLRSLHVHLKYWLVFIYPLMCQFQMFYHSSIHGYYNFQTDELLKTTRRCGYSGTSSLQFIQYTVFMPLFFDTYYIETAKACWEWINLRIGLYVISIHKFVRTDEWMCGCLLLYHAKTTEPISMKVYSNIVYTSNHIQNQCYYLSRYQNTRDRNRRQKLVWK